MQSLSLTIAKTKALNTCTAANMVDQQHFVAVNDRVCRNTRINGSKIKSVQQKTDEKNIIYILYPTCNG
jgi:hypothetical protein